LSTRAAGTLADSMPSIANRAMVEAAITSARVTGVVGGCAT
jgi:hypothetical protein